MPQRALSQVSGSAQDERASAQSGEYRLSHPWATWLEHGVIKCLGLLSPYSAWHSRAPPTPRGGVPCVWTPATRPASRNRSPRSKRSCRRDAATLRDIWNQGARAASAEQREYTATDYLRQLDGLGYEQVVKLTDPTGKTARRYRPAATGFYAARDARPKGSSAPATAGYGPPTAYQPVGHRGEQLHGSPHPEPPR